MYNLNAKLLPTANVANNKKKSNLIMFFEQYLLF